MQPISAEQGVAAWRIAFSRLDVHWPLVSSWSRLKFSLDGRRGLLRYFQRTLDET
jgi:hypothetical protein